MNQPNIQKIICGFLILNYNCNNRCKFCYALPSKFKAKEMAIDRVKDYLNLLKSLGAKDVGLLGGEPTLHSSLVEIIKIAHQLGINLTLYTNGRKLADRRLVKQIKRAGIDYINFSLQSGSNQKEYHDQTVGSKEALRETKQGIKNCFKNQIKFNILTVLNHSNFKIYQSILDEFGFMNPRFIYLREVSVLGAEKRFFTNTHQSLLSNKAIKQIYKKIYLYAKRNNLLIHLYSRMPLCWWNPQNRVEKDILDQLASRCHIISGSNFTIDIDGQILLCPHFINQPVLNLIKNKRVISKEEFLKSFNQGVSLEIRKNFIYYPHQLCKNCNYYRERCTGGCPLVKFKIGPYADQLINNFKKKNKK